MNKTLIKIIDALIKEMREDLQSWSIWDIINHINEKYKLNIFDDELKFLKQKIITLNKLEYTPSCKTIKLAGLFNEFVVMECGAKLYVKEVRKTMICECKKKVEDE